MDILDLVFRARTTELDQAERKLDGVGRAAEGAQKKADGLASAFGRVRGLVAGLGITAVVGQLISTQREFDVLNSSLITVTGSAAKAQQEFAWIKQFAATTPFDLNQVTGAFIKMKSLGLDASQQALTSYGNTASAMGKDLNQMIEAVADAATGEFERLKEFGIRAKKEGENVSFTFQGVTTTVRNNSQQITQYLQKLGDVNFSGAMAERAKTLDGALSNLGDTWSELFRTVNSQATGSVIFDGVKLANGAIEDAITLIKAMTGAANENAQATGAMVSFQEGIAVVFETVAVVGTNLKYVLVQIGREIGGLAAQAAAAARLDFDAVRAIRQEMIADAQAARREVDETTKRILSARAEAAKLRQWDTRNASAATDPRRLDLGQPSGGSGGNGGSSASKKDPNADFKSYLDNLQQQIQKTNELSAAEKLLDDIRRGTLTVSEKQKEQLLVLAQTVDATKEAARVADERAERRRADDKAALEALKEIEDAERRRLRLLLDGGPAAQLEKQRREMEFLADALLQGKINAEEFNDAATGYLNLQQKQVEKTQSMTEQLGLTFASAFENAALGGTKASDIFKGLLQDVVRLVLRMQVLEPMMQKVKDAMNGVGSSSGSGGGGFFGAIFSAVASMFGPGRANGGPVSSGRMYPVNERGPELLSVGSQQFLMMGGQNGRVSPLRGGASAAPQINVGGIHVTVQVGGQDAQRQGQAAGDAAARAFIERIADARIANALRYGGALNR